MNLPNIKILDEGEKLLRTKSEPVSFPLSEEDKRAIKDMLTYLEMSQIDDMREKFDLRPGWGMSAIQLGIPKRYFVIAEEVDCDEETGEKTFERYIVINPKIKSQSEELIYVGEGEGCLSVNRDIEGIVPRNARVTIAYQDIDGNPEEFRAREELSVCFQHEMDHLEGILFVDRIDKKNPFKGKDRMREL